MLSYKSDGNKIMPNPKVVAELAAKKRPAPRGPMSVRPRHLNVTPKESGGFTRDEVIMAGTPTRIRDRDRVYAHVEKILSDWTDKCHSNMHQGTDSKIIKLNFNSLHRVLVSELRNTRWTRIPKLISEVLSDESLVSRFGSWIFVELVSPDYVFIKLPIDSTEVVRANMNRDPHTVTHYFTVEPLVSDEDDTPDPDNWPLETLQEFVANNEIYVTKEEFEDRPALRNAVREFYKKS